MDREEAKIRLQMLLTNRCSTCRYGDKKCTQDCEFEQAVNMAIEALSAEQKEEELAKDIARRMATIIENEQDMRVILKNASAEPTVIRCRTLLSNEDFKAVAERIRETNQNVIVIPCEAEVVSTETSTETSTDLISRADAIEAIESRQTEQWIDADVDYNNGLESAIAEIKALPSAEFTLQTPQTYGKSINPSNAEVVADLISRADAIKAVQNHISDNDYGDDGDIGIDAGLQMAINELTEIPSANRPSGEWVHNNKSGTFKIFTCSECGLNVESDMWCYCPNCGAKMGSDTR